MEMLVVALVIGAVAWVALRARGRSRCYRDLAQRGVAAQARVVGRRVQKGPKARRLYLVEYQFEASDGRLLSHTVFVNREEYDQSRVGDTIGIQYDPGDPSLSRTRAFLQRKGYLSI